VNIFVFAGLMFLVAAALALGVREPSEFESRAAVGTLGNIRTAFQTAWRIPNYRRLVLVCLLFGMAITLFPHYQSLGRGRLELGLGQLVPWLIAQNIGVTLFSIPVGWVADRLGNRLAMRGLLLAIALTPLLALGLSHFSHWGPAGFLLVFVLLGLFPITIRVISNYALEIAPPNDHTNYLSVVNLAMALPAILFAPLVGWAIDLWGFDLLFLTVDGLVVLAFLLSPTLEEPRHLLEKLHEGVWKEPDTET
jgi:MFS family permease